MRTIVLNLLVLTPLVFSGCGVVRNIEQWKCDNFGMCHFGITPSQSHPQGWDAGDYPPGPMFDASVVPMVSEPMIGGPLPAEPYPGESAYSGGSPECENCVK